MEAKSKVNIGVSKIRRTCKVHFIEYDARCVDGVAVEPCPKCKYEERQKELELENEERLKWEIKEEKRAEDYIKNRCGLSRNLFAIDIDFDNNVNFKKYRELLDEKLESNLMILGGCGTGKTLFISQLMLTNKRLFGLYLSGAELELMRDSDYRIAVILDNITDRKLLVIDEFQELLNNDRHKLAYALINRACDSEAYIVLIANCSSEEFENIINSNHWERILSRLNNNGNIKYLTFTGEDWRGKTIQSENPF